MSLFQNPNAAGGRGGQAVTPEYLHSFKAGKCTQEGNTITPQPEKGLVFLKMSDGLMNFCWKNRKTDTIEEPILLFEGDAKFVKCKSCPTGRVFYLKFQNNRRDFFWMQDKDDKNDTENAATLDDIINGRRPAANANAGIPATPAANTAEMMGIGAEELEALQALPAEEREQMMTALGLTGLDLGGAGSGDVEMTPAVTATPAAPPPVRSAAGGGGNSGEGAAVPTATAPIDFNADTLRNVMAGVSAAMQAQRTGVSLSDCLSHEQLQPLLNDAPFVAAMLPLLPDGQNTVEQLRTNISSPQYQQALASFSAALSSEDAVAVMGQFGVDPTVVAQGGGGVAGLLHALQLMVDAEPSGETPAPMDQSDA